MVKYQSLDSVLVDYEIKDGEQRVIGGDILSGVERGMNVGVGPYDDMIQL